MPTEMLVTPGAATTAKTETSVEGLSTTESLTNSSELPMQCSKCQRLQKECQCEQFVESHQLQPNDSEVVCHPCTIIERVPEMVSVEKTFYQNEVVYEERTVSVPKSRIVYDEVEVTELMPVVKMVPKTRTEICYKVTEEEIEVTQVELQVEYEKVARMESQPRVITELCEETITVPVVKKVPVTSGVEELTGGYSDSEVEESGSVDDFKKDGSILPRKPCQGPILPVSMDSPSPFQKSCSPKDDVRMVQESNRRIRRPFLDYDDCEYD